MMNNIYQKYMKLCLEIAESGIKDAMPNPCVGAVLVHNGIVIGQGATSPYGGPHAEVNAINSVKQKELLPESTLYVSLEPCSHFGNTPPCSDLIIKSGIPTVVIGTKDPFDKVNGRGIQRLKDANIQVIESVLAQECRYQNRRFFTFHNKMRPYVILKWAETKDGFMDRIRTNGERGINWISSPDTKKITHRWRSEEMGIAIGTNTAEIDNPNLTVRASKGKNPIRIVLDRKLRLSPDLNIYNDKAFTLIFNELKNSSEGNIEFIKIDFYDLINQMMNALYERNIMSVIIEGGKYFLNSLIKQKCWDEARIIVGDKFFNHGMKSPKINIPPHESLKEGSDIINLIYNTEYHPSYKSRDLFEIGL